MVELVFFVVCIVGAFVLAMQRAPLWAWAVGLAAALFVWQSGVLYGQASEPEPGFLGILGWLAVVALAALSVAGIRRAVVTSSAASTTLKIAA